MLPQDFLKRMEEMLGEEYQAFLDSYENEKYQALRLNPLKGDTTVMKEALPFSLEPVAWEPNGFYYKNEEHPGKHPYHEAGVYYIQEPSAMAPAGYLLVKPGEKVLDLCAAPGGKSTQLGAALLGEGLLVCNEIHPARAKILSENIERMGIANALVTNETPQRLSAHFSDYFDKILVDAPCSGEGMFRKNEEACTEWSLSNVRLCAERQDEILDCAAGMLAPGGRMVYSTCTFAPAENEGSISRFLQRHPEFAIEEVPIYEGMERGRKEWAECDADGIGYTIRLWPQYLHGEGHYLAVLKKAGEKLSEGYVENGQQKTIPAKEAEVFLTFAKETLTHKLPERYMRFGEQLYLIPKDMPSIEKLKVVRPGLHLGTMKKNRFEPSHALALSLKPNEAVHVCELNIDEPQIKAYLRGETFFYEGEKGWYLITVNGYSIGWGKLAGGVMKNHYPKGLRKNW